MRTKLAANTLRGWIVRVIDGDTVLCLLELGWGVWIERSIRLKGIDAHELDGENGDLARLVAKQGSEMYGMQPCLVCVSQESLDPYGRLVGEISVRGRDLASEFVARGWAWPRDKNHRARGPHNSRLIATALLIAILIAPMTGCGPLWQSGGSVYVSQAAPAATNAASSITVTLPGASTVEARDRARVATDSTSRVDNRNFSFRVLAAGAALGAALAAAAWLAAKLLARR